MRHTGLAIVRGLAFCVLFLPSVVLAQNTEGPGCDPQFSTSMNNAAWLAAQSELEAAQRIILKPNSVLQFSCFNNIAYGSRVLVSDPMDDYIDDNFSKGTTGGGALCVGMATIWRSMKCTNFNINNFMGYTELAAGDSRTQYDPCSNNRNAQWNSAMAAAYPAPVAAPSTTGAMDRLTTFNAQMFSGNCAGTRPKPTGVTMLVNGNNYPDKVCPVPGCMYDYVSDRCVNGP